MENIPCVGIGFDSHRFAKTGTLVFGGVRFPGTPKLKGHSDGDALIHAVIDAILGAAGMGDIGMLFPDTSAKFKGISSVLLLKNVMRKMAAKKIKIIHIDVTVVAERPKLSKAKARIQKKMSALCKISPRAFSAKGKTPEGLNFFKSPGGVAVWAVATVVG